jgi:hypothetical protein
VTRSPAQYWEMISEHVSLVVAALQQVDEPARERIRANAIAKVSAFEKDGKIRVPGVARCIVGTKQDASGPGPRDGAILRRGLPDSAGDPAATLSGGRSSPTVSSTGPIGDRFPPVFPQLRRPMATHPEPMRGGRVTAKPQLEALFGAK